MPAKPRPGTDGRSPSRNALRSMPAQNDAPAPVMTPDARSSRASSSSMAAPWPRPSRVDRVASPAGRSIVTTRTPSTSTDLTESRRLGRAHRGAIRIAPSRRIVSPFSIGFSMMCQRQAGVLLGPAEPRRVRAPSRRARRAPCPAAGSRIGVSNDARARSCPTRISSAGQVAGRDQGHPDDAGLRRRIGDLADLALVRRDRGGQDADAALVVDRLVAGHPRRGHRSMLKVPNRLIRTISV